MDTKWKKWTALKAVKIVSFLLIIILSCVIANRIIEIDRRTAETGISPDIVMANVESLPRITRITVYEHFDWAIHGHLIGNPLLEHLVEFESEFIDGQHAPVFVQSVPVSVRTELSVRTIPVRNAHLRDIVITLVAIALLPVALVVQLSGTGRKYNDEGKNVHFGVLDRPYLDITLIVVCVWTAITMFVTFDIFLFETTFSHINHNVVATNALITVLLLAVLTPWLLWLTSLVRRMKAGKFWKHSLTYKLLSRIFSLLLRAGRALIHRTKVLWASAKVMPKVAIVAIACFFILFFVGLAGIIGGIFLVFLGAVILTCAGLFFIIPYANRAVKLEQEARTVSEGNYDSPIDVGGGVLGSIATSINNISGGINSAVNERMKSERLKTELITNVSHDIRTPLTSIITYGDLLKTEGLTSEKAPEYLDVLIQKSQRLKTLTDELFEASKAATGNIEVNLEILDSAALINQVLGELDSSIQSSGLTLKTNLPDHLYTRADGRLMQRVIENLLSNALKYSLPSSRVYLDARKTDDGSHALIELKNISATELNFDPSELTERFKRGDDSRADGGSGLGLSIVQSFVGVQGGEFAITIDGDLFKATVKLPLAQ